MVKIAIIGAGIGGLCSAIALSRKGFEVSIFERSRITQDSGAGLVLWPNIATLLKKLALLDDIKLSSNSVDSMQQWSSTGEFLNEINFNTEHEQNYALSRFALQKILLKHLSLYPVKIHYDYEVSQINTQENNTTLIRFKNNTEICADIIIGADGRMNSLCRKFVMAQNQPIYQSYVNWVGLLENSTSLTFDASIVDYWGCGERFAIVPLSGHSAYWAGCKNLAQGLGQPQRGNKNTLVDIFKTWSNSIVDLIQETPDNCILRIEAYDHDPISHWHRNNLCLIGDAAHAALPTSGQGACQAIEDAYYIAEYLSQLSNFSISALDKIFKEFYQFRITQTSTIITSARQTATRLMNTDPEFCRQRDAQAKLKRF